MNAPQTLDALLATSHRERARAHPQQCVSLHVDTLQELLEALRACASLPTPTDPYALGRAQGRCEVNAGILAEILRSSSRSSS